MTTINANLKVNFQMKGGDKMAYTIEDFKSGRYVNHPVYGYGQIISVDLDNGKATILFDHGLKERFTIEYLIKSDRFRFV